MPDLEFPDFYLVGAPKCGTTAMYEFLRQHPQIFLPKTKELIYFGTDLSYPTRLSRERFLRFFIDRRDEKRTGCAHTAYLQSELAAEEIRMVRPDADIIIMLRNPIDMLHSWHSELLYEAIEDIADFESALDAEADRRRGNRIPKNAANSYVESLYYTNVASFSDQVGRYLNAFGPDHVRVVIHDDFSRDPGSEYRATLEFLGVEPKFRPEFEVLNANKTARSRSLQQLFFHTSGPARKVAQRFVPAAIRHGLVALNTRHTRRPEITPSLRRKLNDLFCSEVGRLSELLDRDLSHWVKT